MRVFWILMTVGLVALVIGLVVWLGAKPANNGVAKGPPAAGTPKAEGTTLSIGLVPERDIFDLRRRHKALTTYLSGKLNRPVEVVTVNTYRAVMQDLAERRIDAAFLGSLVAVLTMDRQGAQVLAKPVGEDGRSTYHGVIFVREGSPIRRMEDLGGRSIAMVRTTTAGDLFPMSRLFASGLMDTKPPMVMWVGTHDDVIAETVAGRVDAGAVMNLRLDAYEAAHPDVRIRRLAESAEVPHDALLVRADLAATVGRELKDALLAMDRDPEGTKALAVFGARRFEACSAEEYGPVYDLIDGLGGRWDRLGIEGPPPKRPPAPGAR